MKKSTWILLAIIGIGMGGYLMVKQKLKTKKLDFTYTSLIRGNIEADVSSTGTVEAIREPLKRSMWTIMIKLQRGRFWPIWI